MAKIEVYTLAPALASSSVEPSAAAALASAAAESSRIPGLRVPFGEFRPAEIESSVLSNNLKNALADFQKVMDDLPRSTSGYCVDEIELNLGFNAKGGVTMFTKFEVGMDAAVKVKIKREPRNKESDGGQS